MLVVWKEKMLPVHSWLLREKQGGSSEMSASAQSVLAPHRSGVKASQKREHALDGREFDERLGTGWETLMIAC